MRFRQIFVINTLILGLILVVIHYLTKNAYVGLIGYVFMTLGFMLFLISALCQRSAKKQETGDDSAA